jgi:hypothetical protein
MPTQLTALPAKNQEQSRSTTVSTPPVQADVVRLFAFLQGYKK